LTDDTFALLSSTTPKTISVTIMDIIHCLFFGPQKKTSATYWSTEYFPPEDGDIIQSPKHRILNKKQDDR
jgi:hypothetical protein